MQYPDRSHLVYGLDADGRIASVALKPLGKASITAVSAVTYLPFGPVSGYTLGNGQVVTRTYDANYRLTDLTSPAFSLHVVRDVMGNSPGANPATERYTYDALNRLTGITEADGSTLESVTYDPTGDRLSKSGSGQATGTYSYNPGTHQLVATGNQARTVDANGNTTGLTEAGVTSVLGYDDRNRLSTVQQGQDTVASYTYNALGERVRKIAGSLNERYDYDEGRRLVAEYGATNRDYVWLDDVPVAVVDAIGGAATVSYVTADQLGTPRAISDAGGTTVWQWSYAGNAWGEVTPTSSGYTFDLRFPGQYFDAETGLNYNMRRDYDSSTGRYIEFDPLGLKAGPNGYVYVETDPLGRIDPLGEKDYRDECVGRYAMCSASQDPHGSTFWNWVKFKGCKATIDAAVDKAPSRPAGEAIACQADYEECTGGIPYGDPELDPKSPTGMQCGAKYLKCVSGGEK
jgi:RHS repeat-associated protein